MSILGNLTKITSRKSKRVGRGYSSGKGGHTVGRGQKGQTSRTGGKTPLWFEGGQLPLIKRMPMLRGKGKFKVVRPTAQISLTDLDQMKAVEITLETLKLEKIIDPRFKKAKIIASGKINRKITIQGLRVTAGAVKLIEKAGGKILVKC